jgi:sortase A
MNALRGWLLHLFEWLLLGFGLGCIGVYAYETVEARRFQSQQADVFARDAQAQVPPEIRTGGLIGMLDVPRLELSTPVIEGDDTLTLKRAVGHLPDTPMPWAPGNSAIAGHRDGLFRPLKDIKVGDEIRFRTTREEFRYRVSKTSIVKPDDLSVLEPRRDAATLTLITCYPFYYVGSAPKRFIVHATRE